MSPAPTRIGVNLLWLVPGHVGGTEEYATRLLGGIAALDPADVEITLFALPGFAAAHPALAGRFETVTAPVDGRRRVARVAVESTWLALQVQRRRLDLVHHLGGTVPPFGRAAAMVTVHDLQPILRPETFGWVKRHYLRALLPRSVRAARSVVAVSQFTADGIVEHLGVPADRVHVVPHGIDLAVAPPTADEIDAARRRYGVARRWFTFPSVTYPFKNHAFLVRAFAAVAAADPDVDLVLTGRADSAEPALQAEIARQGLSQRVRRTDRIPRADLDALIAGSVAVVVPSTFEGFGAPALEAMALGAPVVASRAASLPEVVGDAGILLDPTREGEWTTTMTDLLHDEPRRAQLRAAGFARASGFGWATIAGSQVALWREAVR